MYAKPNIPIMQTTEKMMKTIRGSATEDRLLLIRRRTCSTGVNVAVSLQQQS